MSTPEVYAHFDTLNPGADPAPPTAEALIAALPTRDPHALAPTLFNGLQEPAFDLRPALRELVEHGESEGALRGLVSGSGPTCVFLCESEAHASDVAGRIDAETVLVASGPTAGALG
jgi:4-diphosphocytidyl-2-C-methyl-D-erythritol kinase